MGAGEREAQQQLSRQERRREVADKREEGGEGGGEKEGRNAHPMVIRWSSDRHQMVVKG